MFAEMNYCFQYDSLKEKTSRKELTQLPSTSLDFLTTVCLSISRSYFKVLKFPVKGTKQNTIRIVINKTIPKFYVSYLLYSNLS